MTDPNVRAFTVSLSFEGGAVAMNSCIAPSPEHAAAMVAFLAGQEPQTRDKMLMGTSVFELRADWLRQVLRAMEGGQPAPVISLVPQTDPRVEGQAQTQAAEFDQRLAQHLLPTDPPPGPEVA